ncbi:leucine-rich repeats and immunoglobulin-like domains protein 1 isoform X10 [Acyrthosiphon pisum]|uniref:Ig-like domain-containing protein n=1 Tax=Acyrthosiphon pisum TaxID=7029 RepID=A0A8R2NRR9_ACYPI|nr:leucine-rich repeats and immunoglobulin-like domains protein 1 isoform X10 [Acyrthosiphon pisum]
MQQQVGLYRQCVLRPVRAMTRPKHQDDATAAVLRRTRMMLLLLLLMFSLSSFPSVTAECPGGCTCYDEAVECYDQKLNRIPDNILPATKTLILINNEISDIESLAYLRELQFLNLDNNKIRDIESLANLTQLAILYLYRNNIMDIKSLAHLTKLETLDLSYNEIMDIESLAHLTELETLDLSNNNISELKHGAFANLSKLQSLTLSNNNITEVKNRVFSNLPKLQILDLQNNKISGIERESFTYLTKLETLILSNNNISEVQNGAFANFSKLQSLDLSYNFIMDIESLSHLTELETLNLSNNNISEVKNGAFTNLWKLQALFLSGNKIDNIETGAFNNLTSLRALFLDYNNIHKIDLDMFKGLKKLNRLFLDHNMIRNIPPGTFDSLASLSVLQLDNNPLTCDCNILLFVNVLKKNYPQRDVLGDNDPSCHFPVEMSKKPLKEITENDFNCTSPEIIMAPENKTVSVGEQLQLSCKAVGDPEPFITWAKDDIELELGQRVQVFQNNTLIISKVERTDGGQYKCVASNYLGRKSFEAMVNVNGMQVRLCRQCALRPVRAMTVPMHQDAATAIFRRTMVLLLLLLMFFFSLSSFPSVTAECPGKCKCKVEFAFEIINVYCSHQELDRIPDRIPPAIKLLDLSYNEIRDIESLAHLTKLESLDLSHNEIRDIESLAHLTGLQSLDLSYNEIRDIESLAHLTELQLLYLRYNEIRDIESLAHLTEIQLLMLSNNNISEVKNGAFANLSKLQTLLLNGNKIENIETGVFNNLTSLESLFLHENNIHKLDLEMFKGLTKLNRLFLDHNMIRNIPPGTFDSLTSLSLLQLDHNPLTCDCNILFFFNILKKSYPQRDVLGNYDPSCHFPVEMREKSLKEITENDFNCTSPDVIVVPENKAVSVGEQLQLSCKAVGDPEPFITWTKDDIDLELGQRVQVFQNNTLIISKVERMDGGKYKCVASNSLGQNSFEAMINVIGRFSGKWLKYHVRSNTMFFFLLLLY